MSFKNILKAINQPWLIEPSEADKWASFALEMLAPHAVTNPIDNSADPQSRPYSKSGVMVIPVNGPLMKYENCGTPGTSNILESLKQAQADPNTEAIVLQIDSPGGTVDGTKVLSDAIKQSKKPVVAFVDGMMASAAMWIGSAANEIIASTSTDIIGSIGTMVQWADFTEAYKAKGIKMHEAYATQSTDKNKLFKEASSGNYTNLIKSMLDPINNEFTKAIMQNRGSKIDLVNENVLTGKTYMAKDAVKYGLIDKIGNIDTAIKSAKNLAATKTKKTMENNTAFANVLTAANAESFELVDNVGFALTEEQMTALNASIAANASALATANEQLTTANAQVQTLTDQIAANATAATEAEQQIATLQGRISVLEKKPAVVVDPAAVTDPGATKKYHTSYDDEINAHKKLMGIVK